MSEQLPAQTRTYEEVHLCFIKSINGPAIKDAGAHRVITLSPCPYFFQTIKTYDICEHIQNADTVNITQSSSVLWASCTCI